MAGTKQTVVHAGLDERLTCSMCEHPQARHMVGKENPDGLVRCEYHQPYYDIEIAAARSGQPKPRFG